MTEKKYLPRRPLKDSKVLVAEDDEQGRLLIQTVLKKLGCTNIGVATDGNAAWELFNAETREYPHLVISDWNMPGMSGLELLQKVREAAGMLPFIMITGRGTADSVVTASTHDVDAYLHKPYTPKRLSEKILSVLGYGGA